MNDVIIVESKEHNVNTIQNTIKGIVDVVLNNPLCTIDWVVRFRTVPLKPLSGQ